MENSAFSLNKRGIDIKATLAISASHYHYKKYTIKTTESIPYWAHQLDKPLSVTCR